MTFQHYLLDKQLEAVERWQAEHQQAMRAHDLDDVLHLLADAWHDACLRVNVLLPEEQARFEAGLIEPGILARLAERTGWGYPHGSGTPDIRCRSRP